MNEKRWPRRWVLAILLESSFRREWWTMNGVSGEPFRQRHLLSRCAAEAKAASTRSIANTPTPRCCPESVNPRYQHRCWYRETNRKNINTTYLDCVAYCLNNPVKHAGSLDLEWSPLQQALVYYASRYWSARRESQVLCDTSDQKLLVLLLLLVQWLLRLILCFTRLPLDRWRAMRILFHLTSFDYQYLREIFFLKPTKTS